MSEGRGEHFAGLLPDELINLRKLAALLERNPQALETLVQSLEAVITLGYGDVTIGVAGGKPAMIKTMISKSLK